MINFRMSKNCIHKFVESFEDKIQFANFKTHIFS
ncbi:hypothetical protein Gotri_014351 [Gossypium trilobum]|uniref:Uncharacterized protein n=1 Tax=Gossypium trilobum TaxID=34281 RepID=A0A7J9DWF9_9ROSI|nr:hypothetical protein [Gossypium trilobum]